MYYQRRSRIFFVLLVFVLVLFLSGCAPQASSVRANPVAITVWHYYNGSLQELFNQQIKEFNETVGAQEGVIVTAHGMGSISALSEAVWDAVDKKVGSEERPDIFAAYGDTAYAFYQRGLLCDLSPYLTQVEKSEYLENYLAEGAFVPGSLYVFPIAKSTEVLMLNKTRWDAFSEQTGAQEADLATWEGITRLAAQYYDWSNGQAFFGRDAFANYMLTGAAQLGCELMTVDAEGNVQLNLDKTVLRRLWDNYYIPFVKGHFAAWGNYRTDDLKTGVIISLVGSTSGAVYFPEAVTFENGSTSPIEAAVYPLPVFEGGKKITTQQGGGLVVFKSDERRMQAAALFLKWFTDVDANTRFSSNSGYLPVKQAANDFSLLKDSSAQFSPVMQKTLSVGMGMTRDYEMYVSVPFENAYPARQVLEASMKDRASDDRAAVVAALADGTSRESALAPYLTDAAFDAWVQDFTQSLTAAIGNKA